MMNESSAILEHEAQRLKAVKSYGGHPSLKEASFDRITRLAATSFNVPVVLISLVDESRIWFKSTYGFELTELPRDPGLCDSVIGVNELYLVEDARSDPRTISHPLVIGDFALAFYAALPLRSPEGYPIGTFCLLDKHPKNLDETQLRLLQDFRDMVRDLLELQYTCKNAVSQQRHLLNMAVHDLKNPLTSISIRAQLIERKKNDLNAVTEMAVQIRETSQQIISQVTELLNSGKDVPDNALDYKKIDLEKIIRKVAEASSVIAEYKGQQLSLSISASPLVLGDALQLSEIIDNLISNAIKYCFTGGTIEVKLQLDGDTAIFSVLDNGPGFSEEDHRKMFQPFSRLSATPTGQESSSGLGLSIVRQLVQQHGGKVYARPAPQGSGAHMIVELPIIFEDKDEQQQS